MRSTPSWESWAGRDFHKRLEGAEAVANSYKSGAGWTRSGLHT